jgi:phospholipid transport system substrate-binding protein
MKPPVACRRDVVAMLAKAVLAAVLSRRAEAQSSDPACAAILGFYDALLETMKRAARLSVAARYERLDAPVRRVFDLPAMTRIAVGPTWPSIAVEIQDQLLAEFARMTIATYANRFDGYSGEHFEVDPAPEARGENRIVHTRLIQTSGEPVALNYLTHSTGQGWKAIDVYLNGTISELATRRSEFTAILRNSGAEGLVASLRQRADKMLAA